MRDIYSLATFVLIFFLVFANFALGIAEYRYWRKQKGKSPKKEMTLAFLGIIFIMVVLTFYLGDIVMHGFSIAKTDIRVQ